MTFLTISLSFTLRLTFVTSHIHRQPFTASFHPLILPSCFHSIFFHVEVPKSVFPLSLLPVTDGHFLSTVTAETASNHFLTHAVWSPTVKEPWSPIFTGLDHQLAAATGHISLEINRTKWRFSFDYTRFRLSRLPVSSSTIVPPGNPVANSVLSSSEPGSG